MRNPRFREGRILAILRQAESGVPIWLVVVSMR